MLSLAYLKDDDKFAEVVESEKRRFRDENRLHEARRLFEQMGIARHQQDRLNAVKNRIKERMKEIYKNKQLQDAANKGDNASESPNFDDLVAKMTLTKIRSENGENG